MVEHMDVDVKNVLSDIHERAFQRRSTMQATRASNFEAPSTSKANEPFKSNASPKKQNEEDKIHG